MTTEEQTKEIVATLTALRTEYGRAHLPFEIQVSCLDVFDVDGYRRLEDAGVTDLITQPWFFYGVGPDAALGEKRDAVRRFAEETIAKMASATA